MSVGTLAAGYILAGILAAALTFEARGEPIDADPGAPINREAAR